MKNKPSVVLEKAIHALELLESAYANGKENQEMDWNDVDEAWEAAKVALRAYRKK